MTVPGPAGGDAGVSRPEARDGGAEGTTAMSEQNEMAGQATAGDDTEGHVRFGTEDNDDTEGDFRL